MKASLTVFFENPFWVGVFERIEDGKLSVCKVTFGAEPKDYDVLDFVLHYYYELLFCPLFSPVFYTLYIAAGLSDMLDGFVARKTDTVSKLGARLDTIADFVFVVVCLIKLLPTLRIPVWLYGWIGIIALIKVVNIISGFAVRKTFMAAHSAMNKATGVLLFLLPLTIPAVPLKYSAIVACAAASFAAIQEGHFIRTERE